MADTFPFHDEFYQALFCLNPDFKEISNAAVVKLPGRFMSQMQSERTAPEDEIHDYILTPKELLPKFNSESTNIEQLWQAVMNLNLPTGDVEETKKLLQLNQCKLKDAVHSIEKVALLKPLHLAVTQGNIDLVDFLISSGFSIQSTNLYGETPLHIACRQGHAEIVQYLIAAGANIDSKDCGECTSLFHAINGKKPEVVKLLIQAGCDLDALNEELMSPMDQAVYYNQSDIIALLLKGGCSIYKTMGYVYYPGHFSNSLLFSLWANGDIDNVCLLLEAGYVISYSQFEKMLQVSHILNFDEKILNVLSQLLHQPLSLQSVCRVVIRRHLMEKQSNTRTALDSFIKRLPLPEKLIDFLSIR